MDEVYVMRLERGTSGRLNRRRCCAEQQWLMTRADAEYEAACALADEHGAAFIDFYTTRLRTLVPRLRVTTGTVLFQSVLQTRPADVTPEELPVCLADDALLRNILAVDRESLMHVLVSSDPLAWICDRHKESHYWFMENQGDVKVPVRAEPTLLRCPLTTDRAAATSSLPLFRSRQLDEPGHHINRPLFSVTTDVLSWPVRRHVRLSPARPAQDPSAGSDSSEMLPAKRLRKSSTCRMSENPEAMLDGGAGGL